jgi:5-bromo-4-chloroindolyl phosphate hydrolysis protein
MEPNKNNISNRMKIIDRIITAYKAKKLMLQAQQVQQDGIKDKSYKSISKRMKDAHKRNQRQKKIDKLQAIKTHWKGLN